jgi:hypothetical protein
MIFKSRFGLVSYLRSMVLEIMASNLPLVSSWGTTPVSK